jgi:serine/threonine-protein kinase
VTTGSPETSAVDATVFADAQRPGDAPRPRAAGAEGVRVCPTCGAELPADFVVCPKDATPLGEVVTKGDPLVGHILAGTYRITGPLGEGGMGRLYEAEHVRTGRRYAVKVILDAWSGRPDLLERFDREARATSRIRSTHVVEVVDVLRTPDGRPCMVCERLEGEDLEKILAQRKKLPLAEAIDLTRQACLGLAAAHEAGVIHRDLKPSNLFLARTPEGGRVLKILDFGVAKVGDGEGGLTRTGAVVGTPAYMAPEQARGAAAVDARGDIYALGAVLYRMLTGRAPYAGSDASSTLVALLEREPTRPRRLDGDIPEGVELLVQSAMARDPAERPATAAELAQRLAAFAPQAGGGPVAPGAGAAPGSAAGAAADADELTRQARRARPAATALSVAAALAAWVSAGVGIGALVAGLRASAGPAAGGIASPGARLPTLDFVLVLLASAAALAGGAFWVGRQLRAVWGSTPGARALGQRLAATLGPGLVAYGVADLGARAGALLRYGTPVLGGVPTAISVALGVLASVAAWWLWPRRRS